MSISSSRFRSAFLKFSWTRSRSDWNISVIAGETLRNRVDEKHRNVARLYLYDLNSKLYSVRMRSIQKNAEFLLYLYLIVGEHGWNALTELANVLANQLEAGRWHAATELPLKAKIWSCCLGILQAVGRLKSTSQPNNLNTDANSQM